MFDWAKFLTAKGGIKIHTCWEDTMMIPDVVNITPAKLHDRYGLEQLVFSKGTIVVEDRAYFDFPLMLPRIRAETVFVTRIKPTTVLETVRELELPKNVDQDILKDGIITLSGRKALKQGSTKWSYDWCMFTNLIRTKSLKSSPINWTGPLEPLPTFTKNDGT